MTGSQRQSREIDGLSSVNRTVILTPEASLTRRTSGYSLEFIAILCLEPSLQNLPKHTHPSPAPGEAARQGVRVKGASGLHLLNANTEALLDSSTGIRLEERPLVIMKRIMKSGPVRRSVTSELTALAEVGPGPGSFG